MRSGLNTLSSQILLVVVVLLIISCDEVKDCTPETRDYMVLTFKDSTSGDPKRVVFNRIFDVKRNLLLYTSLDTLTLFSLPLDPAVNETTYVFESVSQNDTLRVNYQNTASIISDECGVEIIFSGLDTLFTTFDSLRIIDRRFLDGINENIRVFK